MRVRIKLGLLIFVLLLAVMSASSCASLQRVGYSVRGYDETTPGYLDPVRQSGSNTCAAACLASVLSHWGHHTDEKQIINALGPPPPEGYKLGEIRDYAKDNGFAGFIISADIEFLKSQTGLMRPVIVVLRQMGLNHTVVVLEITPDSSVIIMDPALGETVRMRAESFVEQWGKMGSPALIIAPVK